MVPKTHWPEHLDLEPQEDELVAIERMIELTDRQLAAQKRIKNNLVELKRAQEMFIKADGSKLHAHYMITAAKEILSLIDQFQLSHLFSSGFIEELTILTQFGTKTSPQERPE